MLTTATDLRDHLIKVRREERYDRIMGNTPKQWPTPNYTRVLEIRLARAEQQEAAGRSADTRAACTGCTAGNEFRWWTTCTT